jgi:branched-chain amino acid transport system permease protein
LRAGSVLATIGVFVLLPHVAGGFFVYQLAYVGIYFTALLGLNVLTGYSGQISLGHGAFVAVGAYTTGILVSHEGIRNLWTIPVAGIVAGVVGYLFGYPALRLTGVYLALATYAVAIALPSLAKRFPGLTGGGTGISLEQPQAPFGLPIGERPWLYVLTWGVGAVLFVVAWLLLRGRLGRTLRAIRDSEVAAVSAGVDVAAYKRLAFGISSFYAGVAGALLAITVAYVNPDTFPPSLSILLLSGAVVGGLGSFAGPLLGALFVEFVPYYAQDISHQASSVVYGVVLVVVMFLAPTGVVGIVRRAVSHATGRVSVRGQGIPEQPFAPEA